MWCRAWMEEDERLNKSELEVTKLVICGSMEGVLTFLTLTIETADDFANKRLPTLDLEVWVNSNNQVLYSHYQKPTAINQVIHKDTALSENTKVSSLTAEIMRAMMNTSELLSIEMRLEVLDNMTQKMVNSGYSKDYIRKVVVAGLKGYEKRLTLSKLAEGDPKFAPLHQPASYKRNGRAKAKALQKKRWFKPKRQEKPPEAMKKDERRKTRVIGREDRGIRGVQVTRNKMRKAAKSKKEIITTSVMFVDYTVGGALVRALRDQEPRLAELTRFKVKIVELGGTALTSMFEKDLASGQICGRENCGTCQQGDDRPQKCFTRNVLYESCCQKCASDHPPKKPSPMEELNGADLYQQGVYVGETSRSLFERVWEHQRDRGNREEDSHMIKHWREEHPDMEEPPQFHFKLVSRFRDCLTRQVAEAVRIHRRSSMVLNSKTEYSRCHIPRLVTEVREEELEKRDKNLDRYGAEEHLLEGELGQEIMNTRERTTRRPSKLKRKMGKVMGEKGPRSKKRKKEEVAVVEEDLDLKWLEEDDDWMLELTIPTRVDGDNTDGVETEVECDDGGQVKDWTREYVDRMLDEAYRIVLTKETAALKKPKSSLSSPKSSKRCRRLPNLPSNQPKIESFLIHYDAPAVVYKHTQLVPTLPNDDIVPLHGQDVGHVLPTVHQDRDDICFDASAAGTESNSMPGAAVATVQMANKTRPNIVATNQSGELRDQPGYTETLICTEITNKLKLSWGSSQPGNDVDKACDKTTTRGEQKVPRRKKKGYRRMDTGLQLINTFFHTTSRTNSNTFLRTNSGGTKRKTDEGGGSQPNKKEKLDGNRHS